MNCLLCLSAGAEVFLGKTDPTYGERKYWRCPDCEMIFLSPELRLAPDDEKERYDQHENGPEDAGYLRFLERLVDPLISKLRPGSHGLDFGSGPGPALALLLEQRGYAVENYDLYYSPQQAVLKREFDFITCTEVIEHFREPRKEFLLLDRLLGDGGFLGVMTGILESESDFCGWWYRKDPTHICFYREKTLRWIASWLGWSVEFPSKDVILYGK